MWGNAVFILVWLALLGLTVVGIAYLGKFQSERYRRRALSERARRAGFEFRPDGDDLLAAVSGLCFFQVGRARHISNVIHGCPGGMDAYLFDYRCVIEVLGRESKPERTVAAFRVAGAAIPHFELRPVGLDPLFTAPAPMHKVEFPGRQRFAERYAVRGADAAAVRPLFSDWIIKFFESHDRWWAEGADRWCADGGGEWLILYQPWPRLPPDWAMRLLAESIEAARAFSAIVPSAAPRASTATHE